MSLFANNKTQISNIGCGWKQWLFVNHCLIFELPIPRHREMLFDFQEGNPEKETSHVLRVDSFFLSYFLFPRGKAHARCRCAWTLNNYIDRGKRPKYTAHTAHNLTVEPRPGGEGCEGARIVDIRFSRARFVLWASNVPIGRPSP